MPIQFCWRASRKECHYLRALFTRLTSRCGSCNAAILDHSSYSRRTRRVLYAKLGADHFERVERTSFARPIRKRAGLGFRITLADRVAA